MFAGIFLLAQLESLLSEGSEIKKDKMRKHFKDFISQRSLLRITDRREVILLFKEVRIKKLK